MGNYAMPAIEDIEDSEAEFLDIMRENSDDPEIVVHRKGGHWFIAMKVDSIRGEPSMGEGKTFSEAWNDMKPWFWDAPDSAFTRG
jgi:hypothetical protein